MNPAPINPLQEVISKEPTVSIAPPHPNNPAQLSTSNNSSGPSTPAQVTSASISNDGSNLERRGRFTIKNVSRVNAEENKNDASALVAPSADKQDKHQGLSLNNSSPVTALPNPIPAGSNLPPPHQPIESVVSSDNRDIKEKLGNPDPQAISMNVSTTEENTKPKEDEQKIKKKSRFTVKAVTVEEEMMTNPPAATNIPASATSAPITNNKSNGNLVEGGINVRPPSVVIPAVESTQNADHMKLERLLEMNYQIMAQISDIMKTNRSNQTNSASALNSTSTTSTPSVHPIVTQSVATVIAPMPSRNGSAPNRNSNNNIPSRPPSSQSLTIRDEINQATKNPAGSSHNDNVVSNSNTNNQISNRQSQHSDPHGPNGSSNSTTQTAASSSTTKSAAGTPSNNSNNNGTNSAANSNAPSSSLEEKDKGYGKMSYYLNEMKKELENEKSNKRDKAIEQQRLREKCSQFEELYHIEQQKFQTLQEKHEKLKNNYKNLEIQYHEQQLQLVAALQKIEELNLANFALHQQITPISSILSPFPTNFASPTEFSHSNSTNLAASSMSIDVSLEKLTPSTSISPVNSSLVGSNHGGPHQSKPTHSNITKGSQNDEIPQVAPSQLVSSSSSSNSHKVLLSKSSKQDVFENYVSSTASSPNNHTVLSNISPPNPSTTATVVAQSSLSGKSNGNGGVSSNNNRNPGTYTQFVEGNILNENVNLLVHIAKEFSENNHRNSPALNTNPGSSVNGNPMTSGSLAVPPGSISSSVALNSSTTGLGPNGSNNGVPSIK